MTDAVSRNVRRKLRALNALTILVLIVMTCVAAMGAISYQHSFKRYTTRGDESVNYVVADGRVSVTRFSLIAENDEYMHQSMRLWPIASGLAALAMTLQIPNFYFRQKSQRGFAVLLNE